MNDGDGDGGGGCVKIKVGTDTAKFTNVRIARFDLDRIDVLSHNVK